MFRCKVGDDVISLAPRSFGACGKIVDYGDNQPHFMWPGKFNHFIVEFKHPVKCVHPIKGKEHYDSRVACDDSLLMPLRPLKEPEAQESKEDKPITVE